MPSTLSKRSFRTTFILRAALATAVAAPVLAGAAQPIMAAVEPTAFEQFQLELINRARANPNAEVTRLSGQPWGNAGNATPDLNEGLPGGTISADAKQPLAFNPNLMQAARDYSLALIANNYFDHDLNGTTSSGRMTDAGYVFSGTSGSAENLSATGGSGSEVLSADIAQQHHDSLFIDKNVNSRGHRLNMMNGNYREVGIGMAQGNTTIFGDDNPSPTAISVIDFAFSDSSASTFAPTLTSTPILTGVVYQDCLSDDDFYTPGEGIAGVTITASLVGSPSSSYSTNAFASGGYSLPLPAGTYDVIATGPFGTDALGRVTMSTLNVDLDDVVPNAIPEPSSVSVLAIGLITITSRRRRSPQRG